MHDSLTADTTTPLLNVLALLVEISVLLCGRADFIESTLAGQKSKLVLSVAAIKVYFGASYVDHTTPLLNALALHWSTYQCSYGAVRKLLTRPWLAKIYYV